MASQYIYVVSLDAVPTYDDPNLDQFSKAKIAAFIRKSTPEGIESVVTDVLAEEGWQVTSYNGIFGPTAAEQVDEDEVLQHAFTSATEKGFSAVIVAYPATIH
ncbi:MAG: hypothetical protein V7731_08285 [Amphritea sp.]